jgi:hypothetical protein
MACGTPVIAWRCGSVPEVMTDGVTGFVVDGVGEAVRAVGRVGGLSRQACRRAFEERFDATRMARDYLEVYRRLVHDGPEALLPAPHAPETRPAPAGRGPGVGKPSRLPTPLLGAVPASGGRARGGTAAVTRRY